VDEEKARRRGAVIQSIAGLVLSLVGTFLVAVSVKKGKVEVYMDSPNEMENAVRFKLPMFRWGLALLAVGFLLQIWGVSLG